jgi:hypothetical protein
MVDELQVVGDVQSTVALIEFPNVRRSFKQLPGNVDGDVFPTKFADLVPSDECF